MAAENVLVTSLSVVIIVLVATSVICLYRVIFGPTISDRIVGLNTISTKVTVILVLLAVVYKRDMLLDVAIAFAMLNITSSLVVSKYLEGGFYD
ncbi:MAG: cation:proton antiporter [Theionarchaea archaeon]|nr:MAG: cation:proton antiporter [Theionarchaea archaeon DG-70-1]MBU7026980.1 cation:proton antiporter [Theionarchaea archaeon]